MVNLCDWAEYISGSRLHSYCCWTLHNMLVQQKCPRNIEAIKYVHFLTLAADTSYLHLHKMVVLIIIFFLRGIRNLILVSKPCLVLPTNKHRSRSFVTHASKENHRMFMKKLKVSKLHACSPRHFLTLTLWYLEHHWIESQEYLQDATTRVGCLVLKAFAIRVVYSGVPKS
jgi:hypothetical protein